MLLCGCAEIGGFFNMAEGLVGKQWEKLMEKDLIGLQVYLEGSKEAIFMAVFDAVEETFSLQM